MKPCEHCGFELWLPVAELKVSDLGLYSDGRFPGRCILKLKDHWESLEDLPEPLALEFHRDLKRSMRAIRLATGAERINFAVLGNAVPHFHGHLIPRFPDRELRPQNSPWDDPRPRHKLAFEEEQSILEAIRLAL